MQSDISKLTGEVETQVQDVEKLNQDIAQLKEEKVK